MDKEKALRLIQHEYNRATIHFPRFHSYHEGYAVILEEMDELWLEVKKRSVIQNKRILKEEAVQVAAMALRFLVDLISNDE